MLLKISLASAVMLCMTTQLVTSFPPKHVVRASNNTVTFESRLIRSAMHADYSKTLAMIGVHAPSFTWSVNRATFALQHNDKCESSNTLRYKIRRELSNLLAEAKELLDYNPAGL